MTRESLLVMLTNELARRLHEHDGHFTDSDQWLLTRINSMMNRAQASRDRYRIRSAASRRDVTRPVLRSTWRGCGPTTALPTTRASMYMPTTATL